MSEGGEHWEVLTTTDGVEYYVNRTDGRTSWEKPYALWTEAERAGAAGLRWIPHPQEGYVAGKVLGAGAGGGSAREVETHDGLRMQVEVADVETLERVVPTVLTRDVKDLVQVEDVHEGVMVHLLRERYKRDQIYTNIGPILISINPFQRLPIYSPALIEQYSRRAPSDAPLEPHVFAVADDALRNLVDTRRNQSILISGESGAGKTEATKQCLAFFAEVAGSVSGVEQLILRANPILEAFGNAKTLRNNNSSRFGKYVEIHFDQQTRICAASTQNYLLEKSRVVYQQAGERNYHSFYQLLRGASAEMRRDLLLGEASAEGFRFTNQGGACRLDGVDDAADFEEVVASMRELSFTQDEISAVWRIVAAILHLGNIELAPAGGGGGGGARAAAGISIVNPETVQRAATLLGVEPRLLHVGVSMRTMDIPGQKATSIPLDVAKACEMRDSLAKYIYGRLFDWIVDRINRATMDPKYLGKTRSIGVLDIFGFEIFQKNSLEQLFINFTNERLQSHFNSHTFKLEEAVYHEEQVDYSDVVFADNLPVLELIEGRAPPGVLPTLDEEGRLPKGTDESFLGKINAAFEKNDKYIRFKTSRVEFGVHHYAGDVKYHVENFLDKNKDTLSKDLMVMLETSQSMFLRALFPAEVPDAGTSTMRQSKKTTLGFLFRKQLVDLMTALETTDPHFIRCIKPNHEKLPQLFLGSMSLSQLRYAGVLEAVKIRQCGYPFRYAHKEFAQRYLFIADEAAKRDLRPQLTSRDPSAVQRGISALLEALGAVQPSTRGCKVGKTRVLYRAAQHKSLELMRNLAVDKMVRIIQRVARGRVSRIEVARMREVRNVLRAAMAERVLETLLAALERSEPLRFQEMREIGLAREMVRVIRVEKDVDQRLAACAGKSDDDVLAALEEALRLADSVQYAAPAIVELRGRVHRANERRACVSAFVAVLQRPAAAEAEWTDTLTELRTTVARAEAAALPATHEQFSAAVHEIARRDAEAALLAQIEASMASGSVVVGEGEGEFDHSALSTTALEAALSGAPSVDVRRSRLKNAIGACAKLVALREAQSSGRWADVQVLVQELAGLHTADMDALQCFTTELAVAAREAEHYLLVEKKRRDCLLRLTQAASKGDEELLSSVLAEAVSLRVDENDPIVKAARTELARMKKELAIAAALNEAMASGAVRYSGESVDAMASPEDADVSNVAVDALCAAVDAASPVMAELGKGVKVLVTRGRFLLQLRRRVLAQEWEAAQKDCRDNVTLLVGLPEGDVIRVLSDRHVDRLNEIRKREMDESERLRFETEENMRREREAAVRAAAQREEERRRAEAEAAETSSSDEDEEDEDEDEDEDDDDDEGENEDEEESDDDRPAPELPSRPSLQLPSQAVGRSPRSARSARTSRSARLMKAEEERARREAEIKFDQDLLSSLPPPPPEFDTDLLMELPPPPFDELLPPAPIMIEDSAEDSLKAALDRKDLDAIISALHLLTAVGHDGNALAVVARAEIGNIRSAKARLRAAEATRTEAALADALAFCHEVGYTAAVVAEVAAAHELFALIAETNEKVKVALKFMERHLLIDAQAMIDRAGIGKQEEPQKVAQLLSLSPDTLLLMQVKNAKEAEDGPRAIRLTLRLRDAFFTQFMDRFSFADWQGLRRPAEFSSKKREREMMLQWTRDPISNSLTRIRTPKLAKRATAFFRNILCFMGDRTNPYPTSLAQEVLDEGLRHRELRDEIYAQIMKQLTMNPHVHSEKKGWQLFSCVLRTFPPSTEFANYVEAFVRQRAPRDQRYLSMLHDTMYLPERRDAFKVDFLLSQSFYQPQIVRDEGPTKQEVKHAVDDIRRKSQAMHARVAALMPAINLSSSALTLHSADARAAPAAPVASLRPGQPLPPITPRTERGSVYTPRSLETVSDLSARLLYTLDGVSRAKGTPTVSKFDEESDVQLRKASEALESMFSFQTPRADVAAAKAAEQRLPLARLLWDFDPSTQENASSDCISASAGDRVRVLNTYEGWLFVRVDGSTTEGLVPANFVEYLKE